MTTSIQAIPANPLGKQAGVMLIEALIAILIFSLGILAIVKLQATSIQQSASAESRALASMLANDVISQMWASDRTPATLKSNFESGTGTPFTTWRSKVIASGLPKVSTTQNTPTVSVALQPAGCTGSACTSALVSVTVFWQAPTDTAAHQFMAMAQIR